MKRFSMHPVCTLLILAREGWLTQQLFVMVTYWLTDMCFSFLQGFEEDGELVTEPRLCARPPLLVTGWPRFALVRLQSGVGRFEQLQFSFPAVPQNPSHLRPVILKPVGRIFEISNSNPIQGKCGKCGRPSHPRRIRV